jgi:hypothetical protein
MNASSATHSEAQSAATNLPLMVRIRSLGPVFPGLIGVDSLIRGSSEHMIAPVAGDWFDPEPIIGKRGHKYFPRAGRLAAAAAQLAIQGAGLEENYLAGTDAGFLLGTNFGVHRVLSDIETSVRYGGPAALSPLSAPNFSINMSASLVGIRTATTGFNLTITDPLIAGLSALSLSCQCLGTGLACRIIAGAAEDDASNEGHTLVSTNIVPRGAACLFVLERQDDLCDSAAGSIIGFSVGRKRSDETGDPRYLARLASILPMFSAEIDLGIVALVPHQREKLASDIVRVIQAAGHDTKRFETFADDGSLGAVSPLLPLAIAVAKRRDAIIGATNPMGATAWVAYRAPREEPEQ